MASNVKIRLPSAFPGLADNNIQGFKFMTLDIDPLISSKISEHCEAHELSPQVFLEVSWAILLAQFSGVDDVQFLSKRLSLRQEGSECIVRYCTASLEHNKTLGSLLQERGPFRYQALEKIADHRASTGILVQDHQSYHPSAKYAYQNGLTDFCELLLDSNQVFLIANIQPQGLDLKLQYHTHAVSGNSVWRLSSAISTITDSLIGGASTLIKDLDLSTDDDGPIEDAYQTAQTAIPYEDICVHDLIRDRCLLQPDSIAITAWDGQFTYRQLYQYALHVASRLIELSVKPGDFIALYFEKSKWTAVAILGVLQAGAAFVLLETSYPINRLQSICHELKNKFVLSSVACQTKSKQLGVVTIVLPEHDIVETTKTFVCPESDPHALVYAVFTSGTTGKPKGISIDHAAYCKGAIAHSKSLLWNDRSRVLQLSSCAFDVGIADYLTTLIVGGTICIPSEFQRDNNELLKMCQHWRVNWAHLTPSVIRLLSTDVLKCLETLAVIGEPMTEQDIAAWSPHVNLICSYGPAECSVVSTTCPVTPASHPRDIGRPIEGNLCWIVNPNNHNILLPSGAVGELVIQGPILAREYLNEPLKTAAAFVESPEWMARFPSLYLSKRVYRTGDLVHYTPNGVLRFVGRKDTQVKLHGQRVELEEVESRLSHYFSGVEKVIVGVIQQREAHQGSQTLVAFIYSSKHTNNEGQAFNGDNVLAQPSQGFRATAIQTQSELAALLPRYMIPSLFIPLNHVPLSFTGKVDRRRLCKLASSLSRHEILQYSDLQTSSSAHENRDWTRNETTLQNLFATALHLKPENIRRESNFFRLGGDSVAVIKLVGAARRNHGLPLTAANVFATPDVASLAEVVGESTFESNHAALAPFFHLEPLDISSSIEAAAAQCQIRPEDISDIYPCTPLQEGLFFLTAENPATYIARHVYRLPEGLDLSKLRRAWESVADANPILKTRLVQLPSSRKGLHQVVVKTPLSWDMHENLEKYLHKDYARQLDLGGELIRLAIIDEQAENSFWQVLSIHHALFDAWSFSLIIKKVAESYFDESLNPLVGSFSPFVEYISRIDDVASKKTWQRFFSDSSFTIFPSILSPYTRGNPRFISSTTSFESNIAKDFTVATVINVAWALTQASYTSSNDVVFGITLSGRNAPLEDIEMLVGPTICTLPIRVQCNPQSSARECLYLLNEMLIALMPYEQTGLRGLSNYGHGCAKACQFQTLLIVEPKSEENDAIDKSFMTLSKQHSQGELPFTYPLTVSCYISESEIDVEILFDESIVDEKACERILERFLYTIQQLGKSFDVAVSDLLAITPSDLSRLMRWNATLPDTVEECLHDQIYRVASLQPETLAINAWDGQFTYREIEELSALLADHILSLTSALPNSFVALCFEKSKWAVVSMLGVMKAGLAFVMLDPSNPLALMKDMYIDSGSIALLCSPSTAPSWQNLMSAAIIVPEYLVKTAERTGGHRKIQVKPHHALYAVYTSGSAGKCKGVIIEHKSYATAAQHHIAIYQINSHTHLFQFASYSFDVGVSENLLILLAGGVLCIPSEDQRLNNFVRTFNDLKANHVELTPSFARLLRAEDLPCLKVLVLGGEAMVENDIALWADKVQLVSSYGPAECSVTCTAKLVTANEKEPQNIGFPIGCVSWVASSYDHNCLVPLGAIGELLIEGPILGRGYLNDETKTREAYHNAPGWLRKLRGDPHYHGRIYKTGDLVKYNLDGSIIYVGRKDDQRKLHGQRIELGQVEHHLRQSFPGQKEVAAEILTPAGQNTQILVAFICIEEFSRASRRSAIVRSTSILMRPNKAFRAQVLECERRLSNQLSRHMIPTIFLPLSYIPLTRNGKQDRLWLRELISKLSRKALADYNISCVQKRAAASVKEKILQKLFGEVLGLNPVEIGIDENYFQLGGDSIGAIRLVTMAKEENLNLGITDIFRYPNISELASVVGERGNDLLDYVPALSLLGSAQDQEYLQKTAMAACKIELDLIEDIYPCTPLQEGLMALTAKDPQSYTGRFCYAVPPSIDADRLQLAWETVVKSNPILRTRIFQTSSRKMYQAVLSTSLKCIRSDNVIEYLHRDSKQSMNTGGPLMRLAILPDDQANDELKCILTIHHALYDGWSLSLLLNQVEKNYAGSPLPRKREFNIFVEYTQRLNVLGSEAFWKAQFEGLDSVPFPSPASASGHNIPSAVATTEHRVILNMADRLSCTPSTAVQLAWSVVQAQNTASKDVVFGLIMAGRSAQPAFQDVIGPTFATIPCRVQMHHDCLIHDLLETIQSQLLTTIPFEQTGLQNMAQYDLNCASACGFHTLLVIQPDEDLHKPVALHEVQQPMERDSGFNSYPMTLVTTLCNGEILIQAFFDPNYIAREDVQRCLRQFEHVLQQIYKNPYEAIRNMTILIDEDIDQLKKLNGRAPATPAQESSVIHELITNQAQRQPQKVAVSAWDGDLTYSQLDEISSLLASHLQSLDVCPEQFVALYFDRSKWVIVALLGLIKAGGIVVFLDPSHPSQRNQQICRQVGACIVLASAIYYSIHVTLEAQKTVIVSECSSWLKKREITWKPPFIQMNNALYAIFTSGSTGVPKCAIVTHSSFCASMKDHSKLMGMNTNSRALQFSSLTFDAVFAETLSILYSGGIVCIPSDLERQNDLPGTINRLAVNWAMITPSLARSLHPKDLTSLKKLCLVGEVVMKSDVETWKPHLDLTIGYGPSECSVICSVQCTKTTDINPVDLGTPTGCAFWIVDKDNHHCLLPLGLVGEILIEGPVLGRGYLNDEKRTRDAWVEFPPWMKGFRGVSQGRLYKTGDLGKLTSKGTVQIMGRKDTQVKLRGQRIDLQAIECLLNHFFNGSIRAVVEVVHPQGGKPILTAFIKQEVKATALAGLQASPNTMFSIPEQSSKLIARAAQEHMRTLVPVYMVPLLFLKVSYFPLGRTAKLDRHRLRDEVASMSLENLDELSLIKDDGIGSFSPLNECGRKLQKLFAAVLELDIDKITGHTDFFSSGGDSISAMTLVSLARRNEDMSFSVADIFHFPTLSELADQYHLREETLPECETTSHQTLKITGSTGERKTMASKLRARTCRQKNAYKPLSLLDEDSKTSKAFLLECAARACSILTTDIVDIYPCIAMQEALMIASLKDSTMYTHRLVYKLPRNINLDKFENAWLSVAQAHTILRTRIIQNPEGIKYSAWAPGLLQVVTASLPEFTRKLGDPFASLHPLLTEPVSLGDNLLRLAISEDGAERYFALFIHHSLYDFISLPIIFDAVGTAYDGGSMPSSNFIDYIEYVCQLDRFAHAEYWAREFDNLEAPAFPEVSALEHKPSSNQTMTLSDVPLSVSNKYTNATLIQLAWSIIQSRYTRSNDVLFGLVLSGRGAPVQGVEMMTCPMIATIPLRTLLQSNQTVCEALDMIQKHVADVMAWEQLGLQAIRRIGGFSSRACDFKTLLVIMKREQAMAPICFGEELPDRAASPFNEYPLTVECHVGRDSIEIQLTFDPEILEEQQVQQIMHQFIHVLKQVMEEPAKIIQNISVTSPLDIQRLMGWNQPLSERLDRCIHDLISEWAGKQPDQQAICSWDGTLTFGELEEVSSNFSNYLRNERKRFNPAIQGHFVPIYSEKSKWTTVAMLGILKAGFAFVLLDPGHPIKRLRKICQTLKAVHVVTLLKQSKAARLLAEEVVVIDKLVQSLTNRHLPMSVDELSQHNYKHSVTPVLTHVQPDEVAFVVFTSGTSGDPKGIPIEHGGFSTTSNLFGKFLNLNNTSRVLQFSSHAFDVCVSDILSTLIMGGCVCIPSESERINDLSGACEQLGVNWANLTPSTIRTLEPTRVKSLKSLVFGGESISIASFSLWAKHLKIYQLYGPAETGGIVTVQSYINGVPDPRNIGFPASVACWVVDEMNYQVLAPVGAIGELVVQSNTIAPRYVTNSAKNISPFILAPAWASEFSSTTNSKTCFYKTGDLVQYNFDGSLRFIGRKDTQVKFHGQRIELSEVEEQIRWQDFPELQDVVVEMIKSMASGIETSFLVAFLHIGHSSSEELLAQWKDDSPSQIKVLEAQLQDSLAPFMVPSCFVPVNFIPLTRNGKVDRRRLREEASKVYEKLLKTHKSLKVCKQLPSTEIETLLQKACAEILGLRIDQVGVDDSFFHLGGDSISCIRLVAAARRKFGILFTVADIFHEKCISKIALRAKLHSETKDISPFCLIEGSEATKLNILQEASKQCRVMIDQIQDIYPCTALQQGIVVLSIREGRSSPYFGQTVYRLPLDLDIERFRQAWDSTIKNIAIMRTRFVQLGTRSMFQIVVEEPIQWTIWQSPSETIHSEEQNQVKNYLLQDSARSFKLGDALVRMALISQASETYFILTMLHALYDEWSWPLIHQHVEAAYDGKTLLPPPFNRFINYIVKSDESSSRSFWQTQLADINARHFPPFSASKVVEKATSQVHHRVRTRKNFSHIRSSYDSSKSFTVATKIRLAWALVQAQHTQSNDVVFGWIASGRNSPIVDIENIVGPTIATVPWRVSFESHLNSSVGEMLEMMNNQAIAMIPFEQRGLQAIAQCSQDADMACKFRTLLAIQPPRQVSTESIFAYDCTESYLSVVGSHPLSILCTLTEDGFIIQAIFNASIISSPQVVRLLQQLDHNFTNMHDGKGLNRNVSESMRIGPHDIQQLREWNSTQFSPIESCVHDLIYQQCSKHPDSIAVYAWDGSLTYRELERLSSQLAFRLSKLGVEPEVFVPLCFEKSMWVVVAILGVIKAGGAFLLLDTSKPEPDILESLKKVKAKLMITSSPQFMINDAVEKCIILDTQDLESDHGPQSWSSRRVSPNNALYAINGSSGNLEMIVIDHSSYCSSAAYHIEEYGLQTDSRVLHLSSYICNASILETITVLLAGGCIYVPSEADLQNDLAQVIIDSQVNWMQLTPSVARLLQSVELQSLRTLVLAGEPMTFDDMSFWSTRTNLIYSYGPPETSICASVRQNFSNESDPRGIGYACGANLWIVDEQNPDYLAPIGVVGELFIEGPIVGREYLDESANGRAEVPYSKPPAWLGMLKLDDSSRIYRTGDLVQYNDDGSIKLIGKKHSRIKLKGPQWINPFELEYQINSLLSNSKVALVERVVPTGNVEFIIMVFLWCNEELNNNLTARKMTNSLPNILIEPTEAFRSDITRLEGHLRRLLPPLMVPTFFAPLGRVPLNLEGRFDRGQVRKAAERLSIAELSIYDNYQYRRPPQSDTERILQSLTARVLELEANAISVTSSILHQGVDSISALRLVGLARESGLELSVADIFIHGSIAALASVVEIACVELEVIEPFSLLDCTGLDVEYIRYLAAEQCHLETNQIEDIYPCTSLQEGIMALDAKQINYTTLAVYDLPANIDIAKFRIAWDRTVESNLILRTRIVQITSNNLLQVVIKEPVNWHVGHSLEEYLDLHSRMPMGLGDSLIRLAIIKSPGLHQFVLTIRHTIYDGWSFNLLMEQLNLSYDGQPLQRNTFNQFIRYILQMDSNKASQFWRSEFANCAATIFPSLPSETYSPAATDLYEQEFSWNINALVYEKFNTSTILQLSWAIVQSRYTSSDDTLFGVTLSGRNAPVPGVERIVGPTFATVPIRCQLQREGSVKENLQMMQNKYLAMIPFEQTGLHNIQRMVGRAAANWQLQTLLLVQAPKSRGRVLFQESDSEYDQPAYSSYALLIECKPDKIGRTLTIRAHFDPHILRLEQVESLVHSFSHVIHQLQQNVNGQLKRLELINPSEFRKLATWNAVLPEKVKSSVHEIFRGTALENPRKQAVVAWDGEISYETLDLMSTQIATHLRQLGVGTGSLVPSCFEKSIWAVLGMLAVLKAGGATVPLDASYPQSRLREILSITKAQFILCSHRYQDKVQLSGLKVIVISPATITTFPIRQSSLAWTSKPEDIAYIVFTSGSSGKPKGIVFEHGTLCTHIRETTRRWNINSSSRILQFASFAFDVSSFEIFLSLCNGGTLCIPSDEQRSNNVEAFIAEHRVNWAFFTPSVVRLVHPERVPTLHTLVLGGEPAAQDNIDVWASKVKLLNGYGPAECTISAVGRLTPDWITGTVGFACGGCTWIVDETDPNILAPIGAVGELLFEGPVVAKEYLNDTAKTAAAFIDAPSWLKQFRSGRQERVYLTGDLVQYNADGSFRFIGRKDRQIKLRGQRIEPAEVEYHLRQTFSGLEEVVVDVITDHAGTGTTLIALISWNNSRDLFNDVMPTRLQDVFVSPKHPSFLAFQMEADQVKHRLKRLLPSYLVPNIFVPVSQLPTTTTNKLDRRKLVQMASELSRETITSYTCNNLPKRAPSTDIEISLQHSVAQVLGLNLESVGLDDDLFALGLDSIAAMRLVNLSREQGLHLTTANIFRHSCILSLASKVNEGRKERSSELKPTPFSLWSSTLTFQRDWLTADILDNVEDILKTTDFQEMMISEPCRYYMLDLNGSLDTSRLEDACQGLVHHNAILRTFFKKEAGSTIQIVLKKADVHFKVIESTGDPIEFADSFCQMDIDSPVPFSKPPTSFTLLRCESSRHILIIKFSHAQYDGLSLSILCDLLTALYLGNPHPMAPSFPMFIYESVSRSTPDVLEKWQSILDNSSMTYFNYNAQNENVAISASREVSFKRLKEKYSVASIVKAAWAKVLMHYTNQRDVVFGQLVNGRNSDISQVERILGPCVNTIPVRVRDEAEASFLDQVHQQHIQTMEIDFISLKDIISCTDWPQDVQFGSVVHHLAISETSSFQIGGDMDCSTRFFFRPSLSDTVHVTSTPTSGGIRISIDTSSCLMEESLAYSMVEELCNEITILSG